MRVRLLPALLLGLAGLGAAVSAGAQDPAPLRVLVVPNEREPEFYCLRSDCAPGFDREILEGFAASQRRRLAAVPARGWDHVVDALLAGEGDLVAGRFTHTDARARRIAFTAEVFPTRNVAVTYKPRRGTVASVQELRALRVGTIPGSSMAEAILDAGVPTANIDATYTTESIVDALQGGKVPAIVLGIERAILLNRRSPDFEIGAFVGGPGRLAYGVRRGDDALLRDLNAYLAALRQSGRWSRLVVKYFGPAAPEVLRRARAE